MNNLYDGVPITLPDRVHFPASCMRAFPSTVEIGDSYGRFGSGIGNGETAWNAALGEYFERRHFYSEVLPEKKGLLARMVSTREAETFIGAFTQTSNGASSTQIEQHKFNASAALRLTDFSPCQIPTVLVSLGYNRLESDTTYYPLRDTSGCCFHSSHEQAMFGALKEMLERQFLSRFWLTKKCRHVLSTRQIVSLIDGRSGAALFEALRTGGHVAAVDISDESLPGHCILFVYGTDRKDRNVSYCAGMAYAESPGIALNKAILELWQTFRFINTFKCLKTPLHNITDRYLTHFLSCNDFKTFETILDVRPTDSSPCPIHELSFTSLIARLQAASTEGYFYVRPQNIMGRNFVFAKFSSPHFFLHMDNSKHINLHNRYSSGFQSEICADRSSTMVPFP